MSSKPKKYTQDVQEWVGEVEAALQEENKKLQFKLTYDFIESILDKSQSVAMKHELEGLDLFANVLHYECTSRDKRGFTEWLNKKAMEQSPSTP